jgi:glycine/D-amino acid oxidase-like deaminating enzyme
MSSIVFERQAPPGTLVTESLRSARPGSHWIDEAPGERYPGLVGNLSCDLAVVGGGYTGLWTALLAKRAHPEHRIVLLEARQIGWAASGRNGGFCEASLTHGEENGRSRWPAEFDELERLGLQNLDEIEATLLELGIECDFERTGSLDVAIEEHQLEWIRESTDPNAILLDEAAIREAVASPTYLGGLWHTRSTALVHPAKLAVGLAAACAALGVELFETTPVTRIDSRSNSVSDGSELRTPHGTVTARQTALATNAFPSLIKRNALQTVPVYDYVLMTEPLSAEQLASVGWHDRQGVSDLANQFHYYRLSHDNRILWGGYDAVYHFGGAVRSRYEERPETFERLASHFFTTFPQLDEVRFASKWAGAIDTCSRFCAFFGTARQGRVAYAVGYTGLGVAASHFGAKVMLDLLAGDETERTQLEMVRSRPLPFPPEPVASVGINLVRAAMNHSDHHQGHRGLFLRALDAVGLGFDS